MIRGNVVSVGGSNTDAVTATAADVLSPKVIVDANGDEITGTIATKSDSGNANIDAETPTKSYAAGYYPNAHGAKITAQEKTATPGVSAQDITPDSGKVLSKVTVNAIPNQQSASGNYSLTSNGETKSYPAGYYANAHGAVASIAVATW